MSEWEMCVAVLRLAVCVYPTATPRISMRFRWTQLLCGCTVVLSFLLAQRQRSRPRRPRSCASSPSRT